MHIVSIVGARPNFMKIAPIAWAARKRPHIRHTIIHTGQHYDAAMSESFFDILDIPRPEVNLGIGSGSHGEQTGRVMMALEPLLSDYHPDWVLTVGDVNSTAATAMVAAKLGLATAHVEAGLRSFDRTMPEEINRLVTDAISDLLLVTEQSGLDNLHHEGVDERKIRMTGNVMIDTLVHHLAQAEQVRMAETLGLTPGSYVLVTLHRPSNVDDPAQLTDLTEALLEISRRCPVVFPIHPRTRQRMEAAGLYARLAAAPGMTLTPPQDYLSFLSLVTTCKAVLTDSGGIQEETTYLHIPCITLRPNTRAAFDRGDRHQRTGDSVEGGAAGGV